MDVERISDADLNWMNVIGARVQSLLKTAQELQSLVSEHLVSMYNLEQGDKVDEKTGEITRHEELPTGLS